MGDRERGGCVNGILVVGGREPATPVSRWAAAVGPCWDEVANDSRNTNFLLLYLFY